MFIKQITIEGVEGDVEIIRIDGEGALVTTGNRVLCNLRPHEDAERRLEKARTVARFVCGTTPRGGLNATKAMIHDLLREIERVAGC